MAASRSLLLPAVLAALVLALSPAARASNDDPVANSCAVEEDVATELPSDSDRAAVRSASRSSSGSCIPKSSFTSWVRSEVRSDVNGGQMTEEEGTAWRNFVVEMTPGYEHARTGELFKCPTAASRNEAAKMRAMMRRWSDAQPNCRHIERGEITANQTTKRQCYGKLTNDFNTGTRFNVFAVAADGSESAIARSVSPGQSVDLDCRFSSLFVARVSRTGDCIDALGLWQETAMAFTLNDFYLMGAD